MMTQLALYKRWLFIYDDVKCIPTDWLAGFSFSINIGGFTYATRLAEITRRFYDVCTHTQTAEQKTWENFCSQSAVFAHLKSTMFFIRRYLSSRSFRCNLPAEHFCKHFPCNIQYILTMHDLFLFVTRYGKSRSSISSPTDTVADLLNRSSILLF